MLWNHEYLPESEGDFWGIVGDCGYCEPAGEGPEGTEDLTVLVKTIDRVRYHFPTTSASEITEAEAGGWSVDAVIGRVRTTATGNATAPLHRLRKGEGDVSLYYCTTLATERVTKEGEGYTYLGVMGYVVPGTLELTIIKTGTPGIATSDHAGQAAQLSYADSVQLELDPETFGDATIDSVEFYGSAVEQSPIATYLPAGDQAQDFVVGDASFRVWNSAANAVCIMDNQPQPLTDRDAWYKVNIADAGRTWVLDPELVNKGGGRGGGPSWGGKR
jgi:hypothetical protein